MWSWHTHCALRTAFLTCVWSYGGVECTHTTHTASCNLSINKHARVCRMLNSAWLGGPGVEAQGTCIVTQKHTP
jgi:hypothetical protein